MQHNIQQINQLLFFVTSSMYLPSMLTQVAGVRAHNLARESYAISAETHLPNE